MVTREHTPHWTRQYRAVSEVSPDEVASIRDWLTAHDFAQTAVCDGAGFGDHLEEWTSGRDRFRIVRDRGQWFIDAGREGWDDWFDIDLVSWVIDSREALLLDRVAAAAHSALDHLLPALREARAEQAQHRFGWLPPRHPYTDDSA
jgi:hypothetical protein